MEKHNPEGAHQGPEKGLKKGLGDYTPLIGQGGLLLGIHRSAGTGLVLFCRVQHWRGCLLSF